MVDFTIKITITDQIFNLIVVFLTTGITYLLFTVLPAKKRKDAVKTRLSDFRDNLIVMFEDRQEFFDSYEYNQAPYYDNQEGTEKKAYRVKYNDLQKLLVNINEIILYIKSDYNDYWQGNELMSVLNSLAVDNNKYLELSLQILKLKKEIHTLSLLVENQKDSIFAIKDKAGFLEDIKQDIWMFLVLRDIERIINLSDKIVKLITEILKDK